MKTLYHGTSSVNLDSIKTIGLVPCHAKGGDDWAKEHHWSVAEQSRKREPSVFLTDKQVHAEDFAKLAVDEMGGDPIVVCVRVPQHVFDTFVVDELAAHHGPAPHEWRAHNVDAVYVAEVLPVAAGPSKFEEQQTLMDFLSVMRRALA